MQQKSNSIGLFFLGIFIAAGIFSGCFYLGKTFKEVRLSGQTISVKGFAEEIVTSDRASWSIPVVARHENLQEATRLAVSHIESAKDFLKSHNIKEDMIETGSIRVYPINKIDQENGRSLNTIEFYRAEAELKVVSNDVEQIHELSQKVSSLIEQGIEIENRSPEYFYSKIDELKVSLIGVATHNAYERAQQFAESSNMKVGSISSARQGVFQITPEFSTHTSDYGVLDTSTIRKAIKAVVSISYSIETNN